MIKKVSVNTLQKYKDNGEKFSMLTAYDYSTAKYFDEAGIDVLLVGDSLSMVILGYDSTTKVSMEEMTVFTKAVARGANRAFIVADLPFMSYHTSLESALTNAGSMIKNGANAVKIEGCSEHILNVVKRCTESGIPVMGHLGFTPQFLNTIGGYNIQGKSYDSTLAILEQAKKLEQAGAFSVVLEMVPEECARYISENLNIPTVSCGAGRYCTGQVLVSDDMLGKYSDFKPKFVRRYADMKSLILDAAKQYDFDVKNGKFPADDEVYTLAEDELKQLELHRGAKC